MTGRGMKIFTEIFKRSPEAKALFPFKNAKPEDLPNDVTFRGHSSRFDPNITGCYLSISIIQTLEGNS